MLTIKSSSTFMTKHLITVAALLLTAGVATAQDAAEKLVKMRVKPAVNKTPEVTAQYSTPKRTNPKDWLELEVELLAELSKTATDKQAKTHAEITFKYYAYIDGATKEKSRILTGEVIHTNVPVGEKVHSVMYVTPGSILAITDKASGVTAASIKQFGVEAYIGGNLVGRESSISGDKGAWWTVTGANVPAKSPELKNKTETPYAPLYGDYYLEVKGK